MVKRPAFKAYTIGILIIGAILVWLIVYVLSGVQDAILFSKPHLTALYNAWVLDGRPKNPQVEKYTNPSSATSKFFAYTNTLLVDGTNFHSLFGMDSTHFEKRGILIIGENGVLVWLDADGKARLVDK
jgi:hypothetical protein